MDFIVLRLLVMLVEFVIISFDTDSDGAEACTDGLRSMENDLLATETAAYENEHELFVSHAKLCKATDSQYILELSQSA